MREDEYTRRVVDELRVQPESPEFFAALRVQLQEGERRSLRRWRRAAVGFALAAVLASTAAAVLAATPRAASAVVDRTARCTNLRQLTGGPFFDVTSTPTGQPPTDANGNLPKPPPGFHANPGIEIRTGDTQTVLSLSSGAIGYQLDRTLCAPVKTRLTLAPHRLPLATKLTYKDSVVFHVRCVAPRMLVRIRIVSDAAGVPLRAELLVVRVQGQRPLAYVDWSRERAEAYASNGCVSIG
jgi:hypothetical protein